MFNAFHASTGSVNYRFEGTADDAETKKAKTITHGSLSETANHLGHGNEIYSQLPVIILSPLSMAKPIITSCLSNDMKERQKYIRSNEDDLSILFLI